MNLQLMKKCIFKYLTWFDILALTGNPKHAHGNDLSECYFYWSSDERNCLYMYVTCRSLDPEVYEVAVSLAERYNVPLWELYMSHLEFVFTDSGWVM